MATLRAGDGCVRPPKAATSSAGRAPVEIVCALLGKASALLSLQPSGVANHGSSPSGCGVFLAETIVGNTRITLRLVDLRGKPDTPTTGQPSPGDVDVVVICVAPGCRHAVGSVWIPMARKQWPHAPVILAECREFSLKPTPRLSRKNYGAVTAMECAADNPATINDVLERAVRYALRTIRHAQVRRLHLFCLLLSRLHLFCFVVEAIASSLIAFDPGHMNLLIAMFHKLELSLHFLDVPGCKDLCIRIPKHYFVCC